MIKTLETDVVVIGSGTAGINARRAIMRADKRWIVVEGGRYGTTCARVGCMPSKLLIAAADRHHDIITADRFGLRVDASRVHIDGPAVMQRVQRERDRFVGFVLDANDRLPATQNLRGHARFVAPTSITIDHHTRVDARAVVIATGSTPVIPLALAGLGDRLLTNETVFELPDLPRSIAVVGTGVIGLELGQAMHRLGVQTTLFRRGASLSGLTDPAVYARALAHFEGELDIRHAFISAAERQDDGVVLRWRDGAGEHEGTFEYVLAATGRRPHLADVGLEHTGLALDARGVPRHDAHTMQCGSAPIFLAGDVTGHREILHEAADEGSIAGGNAARAAAGDGAAAMARRMPLAITFSDPNIALVGNRFVDLDHERTAIGQVSYDDQGRSRIAGINVGLVRIYATRTDRKLVGAEMFGPRVEHTAHLLAWAMQVGLTVDEALAMPFYHPVIEEGIRTGLQDLAKNLNLTP